MKTDSPLLPGEDLVNEGLNDLKEGRDTEAALLLLVAGPRLRSLGVPVPDQDSPRPFEHLLYEKIEDRLGSGAHSYYNSLIRRIVSYARARSHELTRAEQASKAAP